MSIPVRLWRIIRGRLVQVRERTGITLEEAEAQLERARARAASARARVDAARELGESAAARPPIGDERRMAGDRPPASAGTGPATTDPTARTAREPRAGGQDAAAPSAGQPPRAEGTPRPRRRDPFQEDWELLQVSPGSDLATIEVAFQARIAETAVERFPAGSPERAGAQRRKAAIEAAYERLRDALNTTETRFEKLEF